MRFSLKQEKGLTLIELIIAIALMGTVLAIATTIIVQSFDIVGSSTRRMSAGQMAELAKSEIATYLRSAKTGVTLEENDNPSWTFTAFHPDNDDAQKFEIVHDKDDEYLILDVKDQNVVLVNNVQEFSITHNNGADWEGNFIIDIKLEDDRGNTASKTFAIRSRNYLEVENGED